MFFFKKKGNVDQITKEWLRDTFRKVPDNRYEIPFAQLRQEYDAKFPKTRIHDVRLSKLVAMALEKRVVLTSSQRKVYKGLRINGANDVPDLVCSYF